MNDELNKQIALELGCEVVCDPMAGAFYCRCVDQDYYGPYRTTEEQAWKTIPDWSGDIAAMYKLEEMIPEDKRAEYTRMVADQITMDGNDSLWWKLIHATPEQRAIAWLAVMGKDAP